MDINQSSLKQGLFSSSHLFGQTKNDNKATGNLFGNTNNTNNGRCLFGSSNLLSTNNPFKDPVNKSSLFGIHSAQILISTQKINRLYLETHSAQIIFSIKTQKTNRLYLGILA
jgi:hypothetical protein